MNQHESKQVHTSLTQVNLSQLTFSLYLELKINNKLLKYLDVSEVFINYFFFSSTMFALYPIAIASSHILCQICLLSPLEWFFHWIEVVKKYFFNALVVWRIEKNHALIFHAKLKRGVQTYFSIKLRQNFVIKMDESSCQISAHMVRTKQFSPKSWEYFWYFDFKHSLL